AQRRSLASSPRCCSRAPACLARHGSASCAELAFPHLAPPIPSSPGYLPPCYDVPGDMRQLEQEVRAHLDLKVGSKLPRPPASLRPPLRCLIRSRFAANCRPFASSVAQVPTTGHTHDM